MVLKVWVPKEDSSALVLELESLQAGLLPVSAQSVLEEIARVLRGTRVEIVSGIGSTATRPPWCASRPTSNIPRSS